MSGDKRKSAVMTTMTAMVVMVIVAMAGMLGGCGGSASLSQWQEQVAGYVAEELHGDAVELRHAGAVDGGVVVAMGDAVAERSGDWTGMWVGMMRGEGRVWMVFMVAKVDRWRVVEMKPMALGVGGGERAMTWREGDGDSGAMATYAKGGAMDRGWPRPGDGFELVREGLEVMVVDPASGARWRCPVSGELGEVTDRWVGHEGEAEEPGGAWRQRESVVMKGDKPSSGVGGGQ
jgi:hypothetical protein